MSTEEPDFVERSIDHSPRGHKPDIPTRTRIRVREVAGPFGTLKGLHYED